MTEKKAIPPASLDDLPGIFDHAAAAAIARLTKGMSPITLFQSMSDWMVHLGIAPGKRIELAVLATQHLLALASYTGSTLKEEAEPIVEPLPQDHRFAAPEWKEQPFALIQEAFLLNQKWWHAATTGVRGVGRHHESVVEFTARQLLDTFAPSNFLATNPVLQKRIFATGGGCLAQGALYWLQDFWAFASGTSPSADDGFRVGKDVAVTTGKVVFRNALIELIQYAPTTDTVRPEPILFVPAWIMKYYILDLSPENSLVRWLTAQGFTVFMISWRNPGPEDRDLDMEDYRSMGVMAALDAVSVITGATAVHTVGYCLGGTLLSIAAAAMARDGDDRLASITLLAAQTEFSEPGELGLFIDEAQLNLLDGMMWSSGYLDSAQMGGAFQLLRSNDLIWSRILTSYLMGKRERPSDLMAWNADGTRLPYAMHSQYLRQMYLEDALAEGKYVVGGRAVALSAIRAPLFVVGTERDHVAPWRSVYKIHLLTPAEITFVLTSGGHNAGIVSEPGHPGRHYQLLCREADGQACDAEEWLHRAPKEDGSWWTAWAGWLAQRSGAPVPPPSIGAADKGLPPLDDAPGLYVLER